MKIMMIVAMDEQGNIGKKGELPWKLSTDMVRFRDLTTADGFNSVIMGRKTWDSLPDNYKPLPERLNIVMSRNTGWANKSAESALYPGRAIEIAYANGCDECWVIGGAQIYNMYIDRVEEIHVTKVHTLESGDISFPEINWSDWEEEIIEKIPKDEKNDYATTYSIWLKKR
jgi:dihydrofolate reductase|tara:strand:+ start:2057 stop:2569 length:513 start_codon:yes stop_codon:yes gene_type:complete